MQSSRHIEIELSAPVVDSFGVKAICGMFDFDQAETSEFKASVELPNDDDEWSIGAIVGPSGTGKTSVAQEAFANDIVSQFEWDHDKAIVDAFQCDIKTTVELLSKVGFSSPKSWLKPFHVLSNGEQFRVTLARAIAADTDRIVFDEFTSVVDRTVAKIGSAAVSKLVRKLNRQFVAVTCHYDVIDWLQPDWVLDMATGKLARGCLRQRPPIAIELRRTTPKVWEMFKNHHYLSDQHHRAAKCFVGTIENTPVVFSSWLPQIGHKNCRKEHRTVVMPDYQGVGIGNRVAAYIASLWTAAGIKARTVASHPAVIHARKKSGEWCCIRAGRVGRPSIKSGIQTPGEVSIKRVTAAFLYVGKPATKSDVALLLPEYA